MPSCSTWSVLSGKDFVITWYHVKTDPGPGRPTQHPSWFIRPQSQRLRPILILWSQTQSPFFSCTLFYSENSVFVSNVLLFFVQWEEWSLLIWHQQRHSRMCRSFFLQTCYIVFTAPLHLNKRVGLYRCFLLATAAAVVFVFPLWRISILMSVPFYNLFTLWGLTFHLFNMWYFWVPAP